MYGLLLSIRLTDVILTFFQLCAVSNDQRLNGELDMATLFFREVFGNDLAPRVMAAIIAFSIFGNIIITTFTASRGKSSTNQRPPRCKNAKCCVSSQSSKKLPKKAFYHSHTFLLEVLSHHMRGSCDTGFLRIWQPPASRSPKKALLQQFSYSGYFPFFLLVPPQEILQVLPTPSSFLYIHTPSSSLADFSFQPAFYTGDGAKERRGPTTPALRLGAVPPLR